MSQSSQKTTISLRDFTKSVRALGEMFRSDEALYKQVASKEAAPYQDALAYLWSTDETELLPDDVREKALKRTARALANGRADRVKGELDLLDFALRRVNDRIDGYIDLGPEPKREAFETNDEYLFQVGNYEALVRELESLRAYRRLVAAKRNVVFQVIDLWTLESNLKSIQVTVTLPMFEGAQRDYLKAFRQKAKKEIDAANQNADHPLINVRDPLASDLMRSYVGDIKRRLAVGDGQESMGAFWERIAAASDRPGAIGEEAEDPGGRARKALSYRLHVPLLNMKVKGDDSLDLTIAKLLIVVLTLDAFNPGWSEASDDR